MRMTNLSLNTTTGIAPEKRNTSASANQTVKASDLQTSEVNNVADIQTMSTKVVHDSNIPTTSSQERACHPNSKRTYFSDVFLVKETSQTPSTISQESRATTELSTIAEEHKSLQTNSDCQDRIDKVLDLPKRRIDTNTYLHGFETFPQSRTTMYPRTSGMIERNESNTPNIQQLQSNLIKTNITVMSFVIIGVFGLIYLSNESVSLLLLYAWLLDKGCKVLLHILPPLYVIRSPEISKYVKRKVDNYFGKYENNDY